MTIRCHGDQSAKGLAAAPASDVGPRLFATLFLGLKKTCAKLGHRLLGLPLAQGFSIQPRPPNDSHTCQKLVTRGAPVRPDPRPQGFCPSLPQISLSPSNSWAYYRVSTHKQGISGLGRQGPEKAVRAYVEANVGILVDYREEVLKSGKRKDRPKLLEAPQAGVASTRRSSLLPRLDRARPANVAFVSGLMEAGVNFRRCRFPASRSHVSFKCCPCSRSMSDA